MALVFMVNTEGNYFSLCRSANNEEYWKLWHPATGFNRKGTELKNATVVVDCRCGASARVHCVWWWRESVLFYCTTILLSI